MSRAMGMIRGLALMLVILTAFAACPAHAVDVSDLSDFEANPCVIALGERNVAQHTDAPDSELVDACDRAHGSVEVAWDFLTRTWRPRVVPLGPMASGPLNVGLAGLALVQMLLAYSLLGGPLRGLAALLQRRAAGAVPARAPQLAVGAAICLLLRLGLGTLLLKLVALPGALAPACVLGLLAVIAAMRWAARRTLAAQPPELPALQSSAGAALIAGVVNDLSARAPGLLALALLARGNWRLLALGVLLSVAASLPGVPGALRHLRRLPWALPALGVALALSLGQLAAADPMLARLLGPASPLLAIGLPAIFAAAAAMAGAGLAERLRVRARRLSSG